MNFTKEQIDFVKHCGEHFVVLTGGRGHSKTKQIIEQLQQENAQLKDKINKYIEMIENLYSEKEISKYQYEKYMSIAKEN